MRDIKFRAWRPSNESMMPNNSLIELLSLASGSGAPFNSDEIIWMQFTGLTDKNGVDIYEGDITKSVSEILRPFDRSVKTRTGEYVTKYRAVDYQPENSRFGFAGKEYTSISQKHATKWLEVVGNIYSNPELLEK